MNTRRRQAGLSLVELMVSVTLGLIILSGVLVVFVNTSAARNEVERTSRQIENGRYASELLTEDIRLAGFYGELKIGAGTADVPADPCSVLPTDWRNWIPFHLQGFDDTGVPGGTCPLLTNRKAATDVLVIRRARACVAGSTGCDVAATNKGYLQVALCANQVPPVPTPPYGSSTDAFRLGLQGTDTFDRQKKDCTAGNLADMRQYLVHVYYVSEDNGQGQSIPTLKRLELTADGTGPKWEAVPLVEGIEQLQLHYGLDIAPAGGDGAPDVYIANPNDYPAGACDLTCQKNNWLNVMTVQFHILARNLETSPNYTDGKTYHLGKKADGTAFEVTPGDAYRRHVYTGLVRIPNPAGRREKP